MKENEIWQDPMVVEALKERTAEDIAVLHCPKCGRTGYYNEGSHFSCRFCEETWHVCTEGEIRPITQYMVVEGFHSVADVADVESGANATEATENSTDAHVGAVLIDRETNGYWRLIITGTNGRPRFTARQMKNVETALEVLRDWRNGVVIC